MKIAAHPYLILSTLFPLLALSGGCIQPVSSASAPLQAKSKASPTSAGSTAHGGRDLYSDTWVGSDALGRNLPTTKDGVRPLRKDRFVGIFYFLVHAGKGVYEGQPIAVNDPRTFQDNTKILKELAANPEKADELYKPWGAYWWSEPAVGYFLSDDPWVIRRNLSMLQAAGVDVLLMDVTNGPTFAPLYEAVCRVATEMRKAGNPTPQIAFVTHVRSAAVVTQLYEEFYSRKHYPDLWFRWQGKPLILGDPDSRLDNGDALRPDIKSFFTWRRSWAWTNGKIRDARWFGDGRDGWPWIDDSPQNYGWHTDPGTPEAISAAIAGHPNDSLGRSFRGDFGLGGKEPPVDKYRLTPDTGRGLYFSQQWSRALQVDPPFVFVTGWNEWHAPKTILQPGQFTTMGGRAVKVGEPYFIDQYNAEFSRDAMPMKGGFADNYYLQLAQNIRRFKGARPTPSVKGFQTLSTSKPFTDWKGVTPEYRDFRGDTDHRNWYGWGGVRYTNTTGRNDIISAKAACDADSLYFYVRTAGPLTKFTDPNWMQLLIDADRNEKTGWKGYDYVVNRTVRTATKTTLTRLSDGKIWEIPYRATKDQLTVTIPRKLLGLSKTQQTRFDYHWIDNVRVGSGDPADWWYNGDSAPDGRFNYRYENTGK
jgi:hypothetical protein